VNFDGSQIRANSSITRLDASGNFRVFTSVRSQVVVDVVGWYDGNKANDHPADVYSAFADQWRVSDSTSLFDYASGESTATFTDKSFPDKNIAAPATDGAKQACHLLGIPEGPLFDACVLDVSVTGQAGFAVSVAEVASPSINSTRSRPPSSPTTPS
jgi:hypothetical protein